MSDINRGTNVAQQTENSTPDSQSGRGTILAEDSNANQQQFTSDSIKTISERTIQVMIPVTFGCLYTFILVRLLAGNSRHGEHMLGNSFSQIAADFGASGQSPSISTIFTVVAIVCFVIISVTLVILLIFYLEWHTCIAYYLYIPSLITFIVITPLIIHHLLRAINSLPIDMITMSVFIWNFTIFGMVSVFGPLGFKSPLLSQQLFLLHNSSMLSILMIEMLPSWAPWLLLVFMILWDSFAVLAPWGPLNLILNMAEKRGVIEMPGVVYSTRVSPSNQDSKPIQKEDQNKKEIEQRLHFKELKVENQDSKVVSDAAVSYKRSSALAATHDEEAPSSPQPPPTINSDAETRAEDKAEQAVRGPSASANDQSKPIEEREVAVYEDEGTSIGIGDFVFYSLLVGLTSKGDERQDYYTPFASLVSILFGLVLTLVTLALTNRPMPAVPLSVGLGLTIAYLTSNHVAEFANRLASRSIFI